MNKINVKKWHNYRLCDLFKIKPAKGKNSQQLNDGNDVPYIAASKECNGFNRMVAINGFEDWVSEGNCIQLIHIGDAAAGYANYIPDKFIAMSGKSSCAYNKNMTKYSGLFIATIICKTNKNKYSFKDSWTGDKVKNTIITLPYKTNDEPDWEYMESYMRNIIQESEQNIENLRNINNSKKKINLNNWKSFTIGKLFENVVKPPVLHTKDVTENVNGIPYVVRTKFDNGIKYNVEKKLQMQSSPAGTISFGAENATFFYQEKEYVSGRDIYYIDTRYLTKYACLFVVTCLQTIVEKYSYNYGMFPELVKKEEIKLPVNKNGEPDWEFMENYMKNIMQDTQSKLDKLVCY